MPSSETNPKSKAAPKKPAAPRKRKKAPPTPLEEAKNESLLSLLRETAPGRFVLWTLFILVLVGVNLLISLNSFDRFFLFFGIELIVIVLARWFFYVFRNWRK